MRRLPGPRRTSSPRPHDEDGIVLPIVAVMMTVLVLIAAFAVDLGMQRVARRDMQALADAVALDLARLVDGRTAAQIQAGSSRKLGIEAAKVASEQRNEVSTLGEDPTVEWTLVTLDLRGDPVLASDGSPVAVSGTAVPHAVLVSARTSVDFAFTTGTGPASRTALGVSASTACHRLGSFAAALNSTDPEVLSELNDLMGLNLSLLSYRGLAGAKVSLADLALAMDGGTPEGLLTGYTSYADLVQATIDVLNRRQPAGYAATVTTLRTVLGAAGDVGAVQLGQMLRIAPDDRAALFTELNVLDLLAGSVLVADGRHAVTIDNVQAGVPGVGNQFTGSLDVIAGPQLACGKPNSEVARAENAQLVGDVGVEFINLPSLNIDAGLVRGTLQTDRGTGNLHVSLGNARSQLVSPPMIDCGAATTADPTSFSVSVDSGLAEYRLDAELTVYGTVRIAGVRAEVEVVVALGLAAPGSAGAVVAPLSIPPHDTTPYRTGSPVSLLSPLLPVVRSASVRIGPVSADTTSVNLVTSAIVASLTTGNNNFLDRTLRPLAAHFDSRVVNPSAAMLGLRVGGADVFAVSATCGAPSLQG